MQSRIGGHEGLTHLPALGGWLGDQAGNLTTEQALAGEARLFGTYSSALEAMNGQLQPTGTDYIIHALGDRQRLHYLTTFQQGDFDLVVTPSPKVAQYERWSRNANWWFTASSTAGTPRWPTPSTAAGMHLFWQRTGVCNDLGQEFSVEVSPAGQSVTITLTAADPTFNGVADLRIGYAFDLPDDYLLRGGLYGFLLCYPDTETALWAERGREGGDAGFYLPTDRSVYNIPVTVADGTGTVTLQALPADAAAVTVTEAVVEASYTDWSISLSEAAAKACLATPAGVWYPIKISAADSKREGRGRGYAGKEPTHPVGWQQRAGRPAVLFAAYLLANFLRFNFLPYIQPGGAGPALDIAQGYHLFWRDLCGYSGRSVLALRAVQRLPPAGAVAAQPDDPGCQCGGDSGVLRPACTNSRVVNFNRLVVLLFYLFGTGFLIFKRMLRRWYDRWRHRRGEGFRHILLVGGGKMAAQYLLALEHNPYYGFRVDGYIALRPTPGFTPRYLGGYDKLDLALSEPGIDEVVVALDADEMDRISKVFAACDKQGVRITMVPFYNDYLPARPTIDALGDCKLINVRQTPFDNILNAFVKRLLDVLGSLCLIVLTSPIMLAVAVGVKLSSPGPIIFKQKR